MTDLIFLREPRELRNHPARGGEPSLLAHRHQHLELSQRPWPAPGLRQGDTSNCGGLSQPDI